MFNIFGKSDEQIQRDVTSELLWDASVTSNKINVASKDGIITLSGTVPHYSEKRTAESAAQRVGGVRAVADELKVEMTSAFERGDADVARAAVSALEWNYSVPHGVKIVVEKGWITLTGECEWDFERKAARDSVAQLMGVCGVTNDLTLKARADKSDVKAAIEKALKRSAESEGREIGVAVDGGCVTLTGKVRSYSDIEDAKSAAWNAPGVVKVTDELRLSF